MRHPTLPIPPTIRIPELVDVDDLFERFEIFEALHDGLEIANPMSSADLDRVVELLAPTDGDRFVDLACGTGELALRLAERAEVSGRGIDLSPWMVVRAHDAAERRNIASIEWVLGDARADRTLAADVAACLGASWVWHGVEGTVRELADRVLPGGRVAFGDMLRRDGLDAGAVAESHGPTDGIPEVVAAFDRHGIELVDSVVTTDAAWDRYLAATHAAVRRWAERHPGERSDRWVDEHDAWVADQERDRPVFSWTVCVGRKNRHGVFRTEARNTPWRRR